MSTDVLLRAVGLHRRFVTPAETVDAVAGVDLVIAPGEIVGLSGPSGSGKSTLLHLLVGWERSDAGSVERAAALEGAGRASPSSPNGSVCCTS